MRRYEAMVIFDAGAEPPAVQAVIERALETVRNTGGSPGTVDRWGRRPFAYEVRHRHEGYYVVVDFSGEDRTVTDLDRLLSLADEVLRHKLIRIPDRAHPTRPSPTAGGGHDDGVGPRSSPSRGERSSARRGSPNEPAAATGRGTSRSSGQGGDSHGDG